MSAELESAPSWVTEGYAQNDHGRRLAVCRWREPHSSARERAASKAFVLPKSQPCTRCGKYAFSESTICYWCRRGRA